MRAIQNEHYRLTYLPVGFRWSVVGDSEPDPKIAMRCYSTLLTKKVEWQMPFNNINFIIKPTPSSHRCSMKMHLRLCNRGVYLVAGVYGMKVYVCTGDLMFSPDVCFFLTCLSDQSLIYLPGISPSHAKAAVRSFVANGALLFYIRYK